MEVPNQVPNAYFPDHMTILEQATGQMTQTYMNQYCGQVSSLGGLVTTPLDLSWPSPDRPIDAGLQFHPRENTLQNVMEGLERSIQAVPSPVSFSSSAAGSPSQSTRGNVDDRSKYKTELCKQYSQFQHCSYGSRCTFAHGPWELRLTSHHKKYKTQYCREFYSGNANACPYGSRCHFLHEESPVVAYLLKQGLATIDPASATIVLLPKALELLAMAEETIPLSAPVMRPFPMADMFNWSINSK